MSRISREAFTREPMAATRAAACGPVFVLARGAPTHVLMNITDYERLAGSAPSHGDIRAMPDATTLDLDAHRIALRLTPDAAD